MRLTYIVNEINGTTGLERMVSIQTDYFIKHYNYEIDIILLNQLSNKTKFFFKINTKARFHFLDIKSTGAKKVYNKVKKSRSVLKIVNPDIVIVCVDDVLGLYLPQLIRLNYKMVYQRHSTNRINSNRLSKSLSTKILNQIKKILIRFGGSGYDKFVILSEAHKQDWKYLRNVEVISNPMIIDTLGKRSTLENNIVLAVGRHDPVKGFDMLLKSWVRVIERHPNWVLKILGKKTTSINLEKLARDLKIENNVVFEDYTHNVEKLYIESSMLVCSSILEGFPLVLIEAMSFGLPVVSFDCPYGPRAIIEDSIDGILVPPNDIEALADSIVFCIENDDVRKKMGKNASINIQRFSKENIMPQWKLLFENLK